MSLWYISIISPFILLNYVEIRNPYVSSDHRVPFSASTLSQVKEEEFREHEGDRALRRSSATKLTDPGWVSGFQCG